MALVTAYANAAFYPSGCVFTFPTAKDLDRQSQAEG